MVGTNRLEASAQLAILCSLVVKAGTIIALCGHVLVSCLKLQTRLPLLMKAASEGSKVVPQYRLLLRSRKMNMPSAIDQRISTGEQANKIICKTMKPNSVNPISPCLSRAATVSCTLIKLLKDEEWRSSYQVPSHPPLLILMGLLLMF